MITEEFVYSMSTLQVISHWVAPIASFIAAFICLLIAKNHIYRVALQLSSIALFSIAIAWTIPLSAGYIVENIFDFNKEYEAFGEALNFANNLTAIFFIFGHMLLALAFYKFRSKNRNDV